MAEIRALTLNTWGIKYITPLREQRLHAIGNRLSNPTNDSEEEYDIVALQELWVLADWEYISQTCAAKYPYRRYFYSGKLLGPGLAILSKYPIKETFFHAFPINGRPSAVITGDWYTGKGVAVAVLKLDESREIAVLNTHLHGPYSHDVSHDANYLCHRTCQVWDLTKLVNFMAAPQRAVMVLGDLNSTPNSLPYNLITKRCMLNDSWLKFKKMAEEDIGDIKGMTPQEQIDVGCVTCDSTLNTWARKLSVEEAWRLDYVLTSHNLEITDAKVKFVSLIPGVEESYLDHFAYTIKCVFGETEVETATKAKMRRAIQRETYHQFSGAISDYQKRRIPHERNRRVAYMVVSVALAVWLVFAVVKMDGAVWVRVGLCALSFVLASSGFVNGLFFGLGFTQGEYKTLEEVRHEIMDELRCIEL
ncbi:hypothetical protein BABINDRAFT_7888 [Babjeviella inositovora NRRL Y-12698]|uniref:Endonuclease/exonuclease/phosphatase domain-containing protein n=1 Tax=Babjeviella inositovora NRRL Y-12698 TaxID=984486 RepID=A0A1E3QS43_9ASCO|nr:uncharacterized protein BABINDRAFT_7888 [Babjeviella inositovora NRRL Y-12698]ODQ80458.1 hypothetical protein BABINDRAFT_7888 [Babjeviella inositovora NRRL Y-12698]